MRDVIALVNLHNSSELKPLTNSRPLASTTFLGRFAFIDFALSNLTNSGIDNIGILVKNHSRSIFKHLGSGTNYLKNPKTGFQSLFINELGLTNPGFNTDINNIKENDWFLYDKDAKYIIVVPIQFVYRVNFDEIIKEHIKSQHMISLVYLPTEEADQKYLNCDKITVDVLENVQKISNNTGDRKKAYISLETYIFNVDYLRDLLRRSASISSMFTLRDFVTYICNYEQKIHAIKYEGYCRYYGDLKDYYNYSFELLDDEKCRNSLFDDNWEYYTTTHNTCPTLYGVNVDISNSFLANGCFVDGVVKHSILSRNVIIEEGAVVENCIIFTDTRIKKGVHIKNAIIDKHCVIQNKKVIEGDETNPLYIPQGAII